MLYATAAERQTHLDAARQALIDYTKLVSEDPETVTRAAHIAALSVRMNDPQTAVTWLQRACDKAPDDVRLLASLADAQIRAGDRAAATATITRGLEKDPTNPLLVALGRRRPEPLPVQAAPAALAPEPTAPPVSDR